MVDIVIAAEGGSAGSGRTADLRFVRWADDAAGAAIDDPLAADGSSTVHRPDRAGQQGVRP